MTTVNVPAQAQSQFARFVVADLKGKEHAHAFRMSLVSAAIEEALKGNFNFIREAREHAAGRSRKAAAYQAGFASAIAAAEAFYPEAHDKGGIAKVPYAGRLDAAHNRPARDAITMRTGIIAAAFERGYVEHDAKAATEAKVKAAENKAKKERVVVAAEQAAPAPAAPASVEVDTGELVATLASALATGLLNGNEVIQLREALATYDALQLVDAVDMTAQASLPLEQVAA